MLFLIRGFFMAGLEGVYMNRWDALKKVAILAIKDPEFKKRLIHDPKSTVKEVLKDEKEFKVQNLSVRVIEEKKGEWVISIPYIEKGKEMSDDDLKKLTAGFGCRYGLPHARGYAEGENEDKKD